MKLVDFDYDLPVECIAQHPLNPRDNSRLMVLNRKYNTIEHHIFHEIIDFINPGDTLVFNDSRVIPARLKGKIEGSGRAAEILLLKQLGNGNWEALVRPGKKLLPGSRVVLSGMHPSDQSVTATVIERLENGLRVVGFSNEAAIEKIGEMPLPPYIKARLDDRERYQTVYAKEKGSAAAPTAGLHFTTELLKRLKRKGVNLAFVTLHIGLDTFQPVRVEDPAKHHIHTEFGTLDDSTASQIKQTKKDGKRVIAVGTTSVRLLEASALSGSILPFSGPVSLYILPGFQFKVTDAVITNFHLPRSTLLMMISAFAGRESILQSYHKARELGYRFYSFGDAMLII
ncbi:MAG: tRNA preQ1(34) S-adenosylmethionine ribosyltransferase-isomerase QueA [Chloroflexi bacterium]|nr:tRNA preQ1(34) S-adenosylmethionine ribosyltransferase-isomerase QueA [Chloroflexota bacterium]